MTGVLRGSSEGVLRGSSQVYGLFLLVNVSIKPDKMKRSFSGDHRNMYKFCRKLCPYAGGDMGANCSPLLMQKIPLGGNGSARG